MSVDAQAYLSGLDNRLRTAGFVVPASMHTMLPTYHRRRLVPTRFGFVDVVCIIDVQPRPTIESIRAFSGGAFATAGQHKIWLPRSLGSQLVVYPLVVADHISSDAAEWLSRHSPKHYAALEFPVVADVSSGQLHCFTGTPVWGMAYYKKTRDDAKLWFGFEGA